MSVQIVGNPTELAEAPTAPVKEGGGQFRYEMITEGGKWRVYADTPVELIGYFIPGYPELTDEVARTTERLLYTVTVQVALQAMVMADMEVQHGIIPTPEELAVLEAPRDVPPQITVWESEIPLVLVESYYQPQGELPRPTGLLAEEDNAEPYNLIWLDPGGDMPLLLSLHRVGWLHLSENNNFAE
jgi:hypothetical protein